MRYANDPIGIYQSLSRGLVGAWCPSLGASGFRLLDRSGYGNHGTLTNMDPGTDWVPSGGKLALDFDGVNDCVIVPQSASYLSALNSNTFTISAWINLRSTTACRPIFSAFITTTIPQITFTVGTAVGGNLGRLTIAVRSSLGGAPGLVSGNTTLSTGTLYHVSVTRSTDNLWQLWVNGIFDGQVTSTWLALQVSDYSIGFDTRLSNNIFDGLLDDVRIYNRALTPSEIRLLYTGGRGVGLMQEIQPIRNRSRAIATTPTRKRSSRYLTFPG